MNKCINKKCKEFDNTPSMYINKCGNTSDVEDCKKAILRKVSKREINFHCGKKNKKPIINILICDDCRKKCKYKKRKIYCKNYWSKGE